jgi:hypothetical protein
MSYGRPGVRDRLLSRCIKEYRGYEVDNEPSACLIWTGEKDKYGYGKIKSDGRYIQAHHALKGRPPVGFETDHLCKQRDCVRPLHLEFVTRQENLRRRDEDQASYRAERLK